MGVDQSLTRTGYAVIDFKGEDDYKYLAVGSIKPTKNLDFPEDKMLAISMRLLQIMNEFEVDYICMENLMTPRINSMDTVQKLSGLYYVLLCAFKRHAYLVITPRPAEWKGKLGIKGRKRAEQKEASVNKAITLIENRIDKISPTVPLDKPNDDEADAICLAMYGALFDVETGGKESD